MVRRMPLALLAGAALFAASTYQAEIAQWRRAREAELRQDGSWLTVAGLFWLREGSNRFGKDSSNEIVLPDGPARAGAFDLRNGKVTVTMDGRTRPLASDSVDKVAGGTAKPVCDPPRRQVRHPDEGPGQPGAPRFHGLDYFPASEQYRVTARFLRRPSQDSHCQRPRPDCADGQAPDTWCSACAARNCGCILFLKLPPRASSSSFATRPAEGNLRRRPVPGCGHAERRTRWLLDFNKAYNPPCAFTPFATCPLPPQENRLAVGIEAGEKTYGH